MAKAATVPKARSSVVEIVDCEQGSDDWFQARLGLPTASNFGTIMASGKDGGESIGRRRLLYRLAGEILTGVPGETYKSKSMERGNDMEPEARDYYARTTFVELTRVGFVRRTILRRSGPDLVVGASPDSLIGRRGALEIKTMMPELLIEHVVRGAAIPAEHRAQCHGTMWVCDLEYVDLMLFYRGMPVAPKYRIERDETFIREISDAVEVFDYELRKLVEKLRAMGGQ